MKKKCILVEVALTDQNVVRLLIQKQILEGKEVIFSEPHRTGFALGIDPEQARSVVNQQLEMCPPGWPHVEGWELVVRVVRGA